jgi:hypothetical protein
MSCQLRMLRMKRLGRSLFRRSKVRWWDRQPDAFNPEALLRALSKNPIFSERFRRKIEKLIEP